MKSVELFVANHGVQITSIANEFRDDAIAKNCLLFLANATLGIGRNFVRDIVPTLSDRETVIVVTGRAVAKEYINETLIDAGVAPSRRAGYRNRLDSSPGKGCVWVCALDGNCVALTQVAIGDEDRAYDFSTGPCGVEYFLFHADLRVLDVN